MNKNGKKGFTLVELLVVIAVVAILMTIAIPSVQRVRERGKIAGSTSNLRQIGAGALLYVATNGNRMVPHAIFDPEIMENREWCFAYFQPDEENAFAGGVLGDYLNDAAEVLVCPVWQADESVQAMFEAGGKPGSLGYGYNGLNLSVMQPPENSPEGQGGHYQGHPMATIDNPTMTVMFTTSGQPFGRVAAPQEMIWGPDHVVSQPPVRLVTDSEALVCFVDGSVRLAPAIPVEGPFDDGVLLGYLDLDEDNTADVDIWHR